MPRCQRRLEQVVVVKVIPDVDKLHAHRPLHTAVVHRDVPPPESLVHLPGRVEVGTHFHSVAVLGPLPRPLAPRPQRHALSPSGVVLLGPRLGITRHHTAPFHIPKAHSLAQKLGRVVIRRLFDSRPLVRPSEGAPVPAREPYAAELDFSQRGEELLLLMPADAVMPPLPKAAHLELGHIPPVALGGPSTLLLLKKRVVPQPLHSVPGRECAVVRLALRLQPLFEHAPSRVLVHCPEHSRQVGFEDPMQVERSRRPRTLELALEPVMQALQTYSEPPVREVGVAARFQVPSRPADDNISWNREEKGRGAGQQLRWGTDKDECRPYLSSRS